MTYYSALHYAAKAEAAATTATTLLPYITDISTVAASITNVNTVAGSITGVNSVATDLTNINAVASDLTNIDSVAGDLTNIDAVNANKTNIDTVAGSIANVNTVAGDITNVNAVASDLTNINAVAADLTNIDNASQYAAEAKQWAIGDPSEPVGNSAKYWAQQAAGQVIPSQTGHNGKYLTTDGSALSWGVVDALPDQTGQSGKFLTTDGTDASWATASVTVDQVYDSTSANAQSGVAINGAGFLKNTATGTNSLAILGSVISAGAATAVGEGSDAGANGVSLGRSASSGNGGLALGTCSKANGSWATAVGNSNSNLNNTVASGSGSIALGHNSQATASNAIQIGEGVNSTANSLQVKTYSLLNTSTGIIPYQRINAITDSNAGGQLKSWTGTKAQYDAIVTKDANTLYNITDDAEVLDTRALGQIITSTIPLTDAGLHLLDGSVINGSGAYAGFVDYIAGLVSTYPDLFCTEADWQTSVSTYGVCGKFVYDSNTVRLPKITGFIEGTTTVSAIGDLVEAGLPNITGYVIDAWGQHTSSNGCMSLAAGPSSRNTAGYSGAADAYDRIDFDASDSNPIYGNSTTVQPQAIKVLYYIVIATSTKTNIEVDIDEIATDLNGKADTDLGNVDSTGQYNLIQYVLSNLQTTDSSKVGYIYSTYIATADVYAPAGGKWLVLINEQANSNTAVVYKFSAYILYPAGSIVDGGTKVATYTSPYNLHVMLLKIA